VHSRYASGRGGASKRVERERTKSRQSLRLHGTEAARGDSLPVMSRPATSLSQLGLEAEPLDNTAPRCVALRCVAGRLTCASHLCHARRLSPVGHCLVSGEPPLAGADWLAMSFMFVSIKPGPGPTAFVVSLSRYTRVPSLSGSDGSSNIPHILVPSTCGPWAGPRCQHEKPW
jgi:hypothetical protein